MSEPDDPELVDFLDQLGLPAKMAKRPRKRTARVTKLRATMNREIDQRHRGFMPGLLMAFIAMAEDTFARTKQKSVANVLSTFPPEEVNAQGRRVNTLNLQLGKGGVVRLRPYYNRAAHVFIHELRRYDYPHMAPHATQAWPQHTDLLTSIFAMSPGERRAAAEVVWKRVLQLPEFRRRSTEGASPRPFATVLRDFPGTQRGEPAGAILQGLAFAYYRADSPNVTIETGKVGAGSRRVGRVGNVDGWNGAELVLSIEVKDENLTEESDPALDSFLANLTEWPDATAIVVAKGASQDVVDALADQNVSVLTRESMLEAVVRWDLNKQRLAAREFLYFLVRVQRHSRLIGRFDAFLAELAIELARRS